jgi:hypothetical protein
MTRNPENEDIEASEAADIDLLERPLSKLKAAMSELPRKCDAWQDFIATFDEMLHRDVKGGTFDISVPQDTGIFGCRSPGARAGTTTSSACARSTSKDHGAVAIDVGATSRPHFFVGVALAPANQRISIGSKENFPALARSVRLRK